MRKAMIVFLFCAAVLTGNSQANNPKRLKVFVDCSNTWCDMQYIRSGINITDFVLDNIAADVHVLITSQGTGSGGMQYQLIFFGQQTFKHQRDTLLFNTDPNATDFEMRSQLLKYLKAGLLPFIMQTHSLKNVEINLKSNDSSRTAPSGSSEAADPWNARVIRMGTEANSNADANYNNTNYGLNMSTNRITEKTKTGLGINWSRNRSVFKYEENGVKEKFTVNNHNWSANHYLVKSISQHWSWGYELRYSQNTFSNNKGRGLIRAALEYNIFPYKDVNNKLFTISYSLTARNNRYYDTTIYNKINENLYGQRASAYLNFNQKWGNSFAGISYQHYFHNRKLFNLGMEVYTSVRITGGLSFYIMAFGGLTRDQVFLVKGTASPEEVLARRRQLASGYNYYTSMGINYRFGSKLNNIVNPRFDRSSSSGDD